MSFTPTTYVPGVLLCHTTSPVDHPTYTINEGIQVKGVPQRLSSSERKNKTASASKDQPPIDSPFWEVPLVQSSLLPFSTPPNFLFLSSRFFTTAWTVLRFSLGFTFAHSWEGDVPSPYLPMQGSPTMPLVISDHSVGWIVVLAVYFCLE